MGVVNGRLSQRKDAREFLTLLAGNFPDDLGCRTLEDSLDFLRVIFATHPSGDHPLSLFRPAVHDNAKSI